MSVGLPSCWLNSKKKVRFFKINWNCDPKIYHVQYILDNPLLSSTQSAQHLKISITSALKSFHSHFYVLYRNSSHCWVSMNETRRMFLFMFSSVAVPSIKYETRWQKKFNATFFSVFGSMWDKLRRQWGGLKANIYYCRSVALNWNGNLNLWVDIQHLYITLGLLSLEFLKNLSKSISINPDTRQQASKWQQNHQKNSF